MIRTDNGFKVDSGQGRFGEHLKLTKVFKVHDMNVVGPPLIIDRNPSGILTRKYNLAEMPLKGKRLNIKH